MGTKGLLTAFIAAFVTVNVYKVCVKNNVTIRMPDEVPPNISQVFKDLIPFTVSVVLLYALELIVKGGLGVTVAESIGTLLAPLFSAADGYVGITLIFGVLHSSGLLAFTAHLSLSLRLQRSLMQMPKST